MCMANSQLIKSFSIKTIKTYKKENSIDFIMYNHMNYLSF